MKVPVKFKQKIYKTVIKPTMTYGAECWTMKKKDEMLMNKTEMKKKCCGGYKALV